MVQANLQLLITPQSFLIAPCDNPPGEVSLFYLGQFDDPVPERSPRDSSKGSRRALQGVERESGAINCQLSTVNYQLSTVNCQLSTVNCQLSTVNCQLSTIHY